MLKKMLAVTLQPSLVQGMHDSVWDQASHRMDRDVWCKLGARTALVAIGHHAGWCWPVGLTTCGRPATGAIRGWASSADCAPTWR